MQAAKYDTRAPIFVVCLFVFCIVVFTLKAVPVSTQYFLTSVLVQLACVYNRQKRETNKKNVASRESHCQEGTTEERSNK